MILCAAVSRLAPSLVGVVALARLSVAAAAGPIAVGERCPPLVYWQPAGVAEPVSGARAALLDPGRVLDAAEFPPRAAAAYRRAAADAAQLPSATVEVHAPAGARMRIDGRDAVSLPSVTLTLGPHLGRVSADGYAPWAG